MEQKHPSLGLCFFGSQLFYAVNEPNAPNSLARIGSFDFNTDTTKMLMGQSLAHFRGINQTISQLKEEYGIRHLRIHSFPKQECWTTVPKIVYDNADERERYISILMRETDRSEIHPTWYNLSNQDYKFLLLRTDRYQSNLQKLSTSTSSTDLISDFEIGSRWTQHANPGGSFMTIGCFENCISISSFILGKLRGATYLTFQEPENLPYFWLQSSKELGWMNGLHEQIYVYGINTFQIIDLLKSFWDDSGTVTKMNTLEQMQIEAEETTYGFALEKAFPAIMLALNHD